MLLHTITRRAVPRSRHLLYLRSLSTLSTNPHIYTFPHPTSPNSHILSFLPEDPPNQSLAIGTTTALPPTPASVTENPRFLQLLQEVVASNATKDPIIIQAAKAYASQAGAGLGSGGAFFPGAAKKRRAGGGGGAGGGGAGGASAQGGVGSGATTGWVHVSDLRNPPDWGRVAWPEDILGSVEVDGTGEFVGENGMFQWSGTYRICTNEGILGVSDFLRERLVERLREEV